MALRTRGFGRKYEKPKPGADDESSLTESPRENSDQDPQDSEDDVSPFALSSAEIEEAKKGNSPRRGKSARHKAMDFLARRGYSEQELRLKLSRDYAEDDVEDAITHVRENNWLSAPEEIAERVAAELGRKNKGHRFVNQFLKSKGLPPVAKDLEAEVERAKAIIASKLRHDFETDGPLPFDSKAKAQRLLANRGFDIETIRKVLR